MRFRDDFERFEKENEKFKQDHDKARADYEELGGENKRLIYANFAQTIICLVDHLCDFIVVTQRIMMK